MTLSEKLNTEKHQLIEKCSKRETIENVGGRWMYAHSDCLECDGYDTKCPDYFEVK